MNKSTNFPKISIVTPSFNQGQFLEETILSVINQGYPNLEYIIIDGGSSDNSVEIIKKYEKHLTYWVSEPDKGQSQAINKGLEKCTGEFFNWLNSDDILEDSALFNLAESILNNPKADLICGYITFFGDKMNGKKHRMFVGSTAEETIENYKMNQPGSYWRRSVIEYLGGINENLTYVLDAELWIRYLFRFGINNIIQIDNTLCRFRYHKNSKSINELDPFIDEQNEMRKSLLFFSHIPAEGLPELNVKMEDNEIDKFNWKNIKKKHTTRYNSFKCKELFLRLYFEKKYKHAFKVMINYIKNGSVGFDRDLFIIIIKLIIRYSQAGYQKFVKKHNLICISN